jgi:hypothetical protein
VANDVSTGLDNAIITYRSVEPVTTGADFHYDPMETDENDSQGSNSDTENTDGAASDAKEAWPWPTGLTYDRKRIMAYRTHSRGYRAIVEPERGSEVFDIRSRMERGGFEMNRYLVQEGRLQLKHPATRRKWLYEHRSDFVKLWYLATPDYKTHNKDSNSGGRRKDSKAWGFVQWNWGFEEIIVSDLRKVIVRDGRG